MLLCSSASLFLFFVSANRFVEGSNHQRPHYPLLTATFFVGSRAHHADQSNHQWSNKCSSASFFLVLANQFAKGSNRWHARYPHSCSFFFVGLRAHHANQLNHRQSNKCSSSSQFLFLFQLTDWPKEATIGIPATPLLAASFLLVQGLVTLTD